MTTQSNLIVAHVLIYKPCHIRPRQTFPIAVLTDTPIFEWFVVWRRSMFDYQKKDMLLKTIDCVLRT